MSRRAFIEVKDIIIEDKQYFNTIFEISEWTNKNTHPLRKSNKKTILIIFSLLINNLSTFKTAPL